MVALFFAARLVVQGSVVEENVGNVFVKYAGLPMDLIKSEQAIFRKYRATR